jgi:Zn-dependent peptidase ImmA (M78 family)
MELEVYCEPIQKKYFDYIEYVLDKLPEEDQKKIIEECVIFVVGWCHGSHHCFFQNKAPIILNAWHMELENLCLKQKRHVIAHEFAHHILEHTPNINKYHEKKQEKEANALASEWGFPYDAKKKK